MKTTSLLISLVIACFAFSAKAALTVTNTLNPTAISGTNVSQPVLIGYVTFRYAPSFVINTSGLLTTNSALFYPTVGTTTNAGTIISTNSFTSTNAASMTVPAINITVPIYGWVQTVTTNSTTVWQSVIQTTP